MFDLSWGEMLVIGVVALIAIGPKELPGVLRMVGQWLGKARRMAADFQGQFQEAMREAELAELRKQFDEVKEGVANASAPVSKSISEFQKEVEASLSAGVPVDGLLSAPGALPQPGGPVSDLNATSPSIAALATGSSSAIAAPPTVTDISTPLSGPSVPPTGDGVAEQHPVQAVEDGLADGRPVARPAADPARESGTPS